MVRKRVCIEFDDWTGSEPRNPNGAVVIEDRYAVGGYPHIAFKTGCSESKCKVKRFMGVFWCMGTRPPMGEENRRIDERGKSLLLHSPMVA